jgi:hypothetical protein
MIDGKWAEDITAMVTSFTMRIVGECYDLVREKNFTPSSGNFDGGWQIGQQGINKACIKSGNWTCDHGSARAAVSESFCSSCIRSH